MDFLNTVEDLEALYGTPVEMSVRKVTDHLTSAYRTWIEASRFCVLTTVGPEGTDGSPRGDDGSVVAILDPQTLALPDWRGNERIDSLRNIVRDSRVSLMFMVPGSNNVMRVNGDARLTADADLRARFDKGGKQPRVVIVIRIHEVYPQCARAIVRSGLWSSGGDTVGLPTIGEMMTDLTSGAFDGETYDKEWPERAKSTLW
ncbi:pyridoxamine 5'-phosphate oxidase family protein [Aliiroseovarius sp. Z3]|uniref:pyridoxamine 5'-phosphate oxidase family protein n=1 Tax=Aliiroseovarius sp. Z3 TaxID=2811402 RepID=UPI0023B233C6|nr:pyridoxamine 5'-phosphate oxidase family protein [Aliiroseovarius sp. Z3]MDE9449434.1 pyridoxamine 5'-phosphate oxidase family protein [Aliiroseovarius sp. Z3]